MKFAGVHYISACDSNNEKVLRERSNMIALEDAFEFSYTR